ncbi:MAG: 2-oxoglutarate dehydrogenase, E2 component, dihydrolipoamide succinyltransferase [Acidobacteria bacterium]|nr:2-oxoglutarate dehydrogenase, E2 component, dihydrolipoamide succinyltransferase [Acidobacteriota bacterium]
MSVEVVMPQMGESITEGTVSKWLKAVGDKIEKDEPILEISTDKVDAEVPAPGAGVLLEIRTAEGETVEVGTVVAVIGEAAEAGAAAPPPAKTETPAAPVVETPAPTVETPAPVVETPAPAAENPKSEIRNPKSPLTEVVMPQMGESITEGTVSKWLKAVGDRIEKDEPLLEISTDKVDAEVPSPAAGTLLEIRAAEGETVEVGTVVALVGAEGAAAAPVAEAPKPVETPVAAAPVEAPKPVEAAPAEPVRIAAASAGGGAISVEELRRTKSSPLVRNIAREHGIDITRIPGSGLSGRVTKNDILNFIETGAALRPQDLMVGKVAAPVSAPVATPVKPAVQPPPSAIQHPTSGDRVEPMSVMRRKIAEHMTFSKQTSAHVTSVYEIDMTNVAKFRSRHKDEFQARFGTKLTFMPFVFQTVNQALRKFPVVNAQVADGNIIYKGDINLGMAVALDWGLIVPVIKKADTLSLSGLALTANDLADRARTKKLMPDEVQGGTFTITNPGVFGGLFGTPIINQPQVAILCVGAIEKRPKVLTTPDGDDYIAIRQMAYFALTYDHRIVDGADAERFLSFMKEYLETTPFSL